MMFLKKMLLNKALKGAAAGMIGGLAASLVMNLFQSGVQAATDKLDPMAEARDSQSQGLQSDEDATMKMVGRISENLLDRPLDRDQRAKLGPVVHYTFGAMMGGLYGLTSEFVGGARAGFGAGFGTVLFLAADEVAVPVMGLSGPPSQTPAKQHAMAWASHIVYGVSTELVRKTVRPLL